MKSYLALDLGTVTGWAALSNGLVTSGTESFKSNRYSGGGMRFLMFAAWLDRLPKPELVLFEEVRRHLGVDAAHVYGGFLAHLTAWCEAREIPYLGVPVGTIKKHATARGNADKAAMIQSARAKGYSPQDDNEADALLLLDYAMASWPEGLQ